MSRIFPRCLCLLSCWIAAPCAEAQELPVSAKIGVPFSLTADGTEYSLRPLSAAATADAIDLEYPDLLTGHLIGAKNDPGPCHPVQGKRYSVRISNGACLLTNSCDSGTYLCFSKIRVSGTDVTFVVTPRRESFEPR